MKKLGIVSVLALVVFCSCKKKYECRCEKIGWSYYKERSREKATTACANKAAGAGDKCFIAN
jgi:hypothetical protein